MKIEGNTAIEYIHEQGVKHVAKNLILNNFDLSQISDLTGLSMEELREIGTELNHDKANLAAIGSAR